jgi:hypothetical protein
MPPVTQAPSTHCCAPLQVAHIAPFCPQALFALPLRHSWSALQHPVHEESQVGCCGPEPHASTKTTHTEERRMARHATSRPARVPWCHAKHPVLKPLSRRDTLSNPSAQQVRIVRTSQ